MALLTCSRCKATAEGATFEEADSLIDHSNGKSKGWPCSGNPDYLVWEGKTATVEKVATTPKTSKSK